MAKILEIITKLNPKIRQKSIEIPVKKILTKEISTLLKDMEKTMIKKDGIGLAAPQIGENIRLFVINTKDGAEFFINPKILKKSIIKEWGEEGCLSVPNIFGKVKRHKKLICQYTDASGKEKTITAQGLLARVIQHENDHLDGILFIDKAIELKELKTTDIKK